MQHFGVCKKRALGIPMPLPAMLNQKYRQAVRIMKITAFILLVCTLQVSAKGYSQSITLSEKEAPLDKVFKSIEKQTDYIFFYNVDWVKKTDKVSVEVKNMQLQQVLDLLFKNQPLAYSITGKMITVFPKKNDAPNPNNNIKLPIDIHGRVIDENNKPVAGVTVTVRGTKKQTLTNENGEFTILDVSDGVVLLFSTVNMEPLEIYLKGQKEVLARLKTKTSELDEVQIIAYGQTTKRLQTGNVNSVKGDDIRKQPVGNALLALEGRVPGLLITQNNGISGGGITVRVQGQNSIASGNDPLYVIDGVPYYSQLPATGLENVLGKSGTIGQGNVPFAGNPLSYINPADIESVDVLKDADATAIYGSRAANGAILITTRKGKSGPTRFNINGQYGWGKVARKIEMLNTSQYLAMRKEAFRNDGKPIPVRKPSATSDYDLTIWDSLQYTDWQKELIGNTAKYINVNADVSGGTQQLQYLVGATFNKQTTVFPLPNDFSDQKGALHFNLISHSLNQRFALQFSGNYMVDKNQLPYQDLTSFAIKREPNAPSLYNNDGTLNWAPNANGTSTSVNPLATSLYTKYQNTTYNLVSNLKASYKVLADLDISTSFGFSRMTTDDFYGTPMTAIRPELRANSDRSAVYGDRKLNSWIIEPMASYKKQIGLGKIEALLGATVQQNSANGGYIVGVGYNNDEVLQDLKAASSITVGNYYITKYKYAAGFMRVNYSFNEKYIIDLTGRRDGSSRFGEGNRFHNFGAIGAAWIFSSEKIIKSLLPVLSFGKIRGSFGTTGNDQIADYGYLGLYDQVYNVDIPYQGTTGLQPIGLPNPHLQWEETKKLQIGLDLGLMRDRILFSATYARNRSSNQLLSYILPAITGFQGITQNFPATVQNTSCELVLTTINLKKRIIKWSSSVNLTIPRNKLISFPDLPNSSYANTLVTGMPINIIKTYKYMGVSSTQGLYQVDDTHGNPTTSYPTADRNTIIDVTPRFYGGLQNSITFRNFEVDFLFQFVKQKGVNAYYDNGSASPGRFSRGASNQPVTVLDHWQKPGDVVSIQKYSTAQINGLVYSSDAIYSDASFIRFKNISVSWEIPQKWKKEKGLQNCRIYLQGQNLFTITKYKGLDPETRTLNTLPPLKMLTVGLQIGL